WGRLALSVIAEWLREQRESVAHREHLIDLNSIESTFQHMRVVFDLMDTKTEAGWSAIAARFETMARATCGYVAGLEEGRRAGEFVGRRRVLAVIAQVRTAAGDESFIVPMLRAAATARVPDSLKARLEKAAPIARAAFAELADYLEQTYLPSAADR